MIQSIEEVSPHVIALRVSDHIEAEELEDAIQQFDTKLAENEQMSFYVEIAEWEGMSFQAFIKDVRYSISHLRSLTRIQRVAIVTDEDWLATLARWENRIFPTMELRTFAVEDRDEALAWVNEDLDVPRDATRVIQGAPKQSSNGTPIIGLEVDGRLNPHDLDQVDDLMGEHEKVRVLALIKRMHRVSPHVFASMKGDYSLGALARIERFAIVDVHELVRRTIEFFAPAMGPEVRCFDADELDDAWAWLKE